MELRMAGISSADINPDPIKSSRSVINVTGKSKLEEIHIYVLLIRFKAAFPPVSLFQYFCKVLLVNPKKRGDTVIIKK